MGYESTARKYAKRYGLNPDVFVRQIRAESGFNPNSGSSAGAIGIAQIMPATARSWGVNPRDPNASLKAAAKHMATYVKQYGSYRDALVAYNAGPGRVGKPLYSETANYVAKILPNGEPAEASGGSSRTVMRSDPALRQQALLAYAQHKMPGGLLGLAGQLEAAKQPVEVAPDAAVSTQPGPKGKSAKSQGLSPLLEMFYDPLGGFDNPSHQRGGVKKIPPIGGHSDHVHVAAGPKTLSRLDKRAGDFGLGVSSADRPGAVTKSGNQSFHAVGKARDYSGSSKQMMAFAKYVAKLYGVER